MNVTIEQEEKLAHFIEIIAASRGKLNPWEQKFFDDQEKRYDEHGSKITLTGKQWSVLNSIYEKVTD